MKQLEFKICRQCGEVINDMFCYKCGTLNYKEEQKDEITKEYEEVVIQEMEKIGYLASIAPDSKTLWLSKDEDFEIDFDEFTGMEFKLVLVEEFDTIHKLAELIDYLKED